MIIMYYSEKNAYEDNKLDWYINSINTAKEDGINICGIIDYRFIDGTTSSFKNDTLNYTTGLFIEDKALGNCYDSASIFFDNIVDEENYLEKQHNYIEELEKRSKADVNILEKLINDLFLLRIMVLYLIQSHLIFSMMNLLDTA